MTKTTNRAVFGLLALLLLGGAAGALIAWFGWIGSGAMPLAAPSISRPVVPDSRADALGNTAQSSAVVVAPYAKAALGSASAAFAQAWDISRLLAPTSTAAPKPPGWRIVGTTDIGGLQSVLVLFEGVSAPESKVVGDRLPGGAQILGVDGTSVSIRLNGKRVYLNTVH